jgi:hypothetical protein
MVRSRVADRGDGLQVWRVAVNMLNKQLRTADSGWSSSLGVGWWANNPSPWNSIFVTKHYAQPRNRTDYLAQPKHRNFCISSKSGFWYDETWCLAIATVHVLWNKPCLSCWFCSRIALIFVSSEPFCFVLFFLFVFFLCFITLLLFVHALHPFFL